ncbi:MAG: biopolymer transporter ExbB [Bdellovibrionales bacterium CG12_big_fil_rev_8_21_14_0_65_38_15]|nr:MAG: biopolymer transporter ExbB [Bdellovibrionales bacterium CG22_combo_CG10-13_8_21_14_all_38_13]PIQ54112.1 MAG: biopolymer transporter ExbB [Bdellovibrionales bacterium CG12_big_fil_rev_8_21_14_0_65_38_15]PIR28789.1 MAG: biopolymer transporter ExbB [Bdellovibrionales bacterium CG11_big_fil_rev_8_21_14_0_20_38_13]
MSLWNYIQQGGAIMYLLLLLNIIGFALMISKFVILKRETSNASDTASRLSANIPKGSADSVLELAKQEIASYIAGIEAGLNTIKIIATISPLLGLLGTVVGILLAFQVISQTGLSDPANFAQGISLALITTVGGLIVAIPHFIGHTYLIGSLDRLEAQIEKSVLAQVLK